MDINRLASLEVLADYHQNNQRLVGVTERIANQSKATSSKEDPVLWADVQQLKQYSATLSGFSDNLNRGAASVRVALDSMEASRQHLLQLEERLNAAFAEEPGSDARARALKQFNELHRYLNDTAHAPDAGARRLLDNPKEYLEAGDVEIRAGEAGFSLTLRSREIHTGATGLDLPKAGEAIPSDLEADPGADPVIADIESASNEEIGKMIDLLENAKAEITAKAKALAVDASAIEQAEGFNDAYILRNDTLAEKLELPDLNAEAALAKAINLKNSLAISGISGIRDTQRLALQLLR